MSLLMSGVWSLSFVVYGDEVKNVTGELCRKNALSALVRFVRILFILVFLVSGTVPLLFLIIFQEDTIEKRELRVFKIL